jgi:hypothetical protein
MRHPRAKVYLLTATFLAGGIFGLLVVAYYNFTSEQVKYPHIPIVFWSIAGLVLGWLLWLAVKLTKWLFGRNYGTRNTDPAIRRAGQENDGLHYAQRLKLAPTYWVIVGTILGITNGIIIAAFYSATYSTWLGQVVLIGLAGGLIGMAVRSVYLGWESVRALLECALGIVVCMSVGGLFGLIAASIDAGFIILTRFDSRSEREMAQVLVMYCGGGGTLVGTILFGIRWIVEPRSPKKTDI